MIGTHYTSGQENNVRTTGWVKRNTQENNNNKTIFQRKSHWFTCFPVQFSDYLSLYFWPSSRFRNRLIRSRIVIYLDDFCPGNCTARKFITFSVFERNLSKLTLNIYWTISDITEKIHRTSPLPTLARGLNWYITDDRWVPFLKESPETNSF